MPEKKAIRRSMNAMVNQEDIMSFRVSEFQSFRVSEFQSFRVSGFQVAH